MTEDTPAFFAIDRGTVSTAVSLIAPVAGRYRMIASAVAPSGIDPEALLEDLAWRVARTDASVAGTMEGWRGWSRLEVRSWRAPRATLVAATSATGELLARAFSAAGWAIEARFFGPEPDLIGLGQACLDGRVDAVVVAVRDEADEEELGRARMLWPRAGALARFRDDVAVIACGPFSDRPEGIPDDRVYALPAPTAVALTAESALRGAAAQVGIHLASAGESGIDGRAALRTATASLAALLGQRVDGLDVGASASSRTLADADTELGHAVVAEAALLPAELLDDEDAGDAVLRWSTASGDPSARLDQLRELVSRPWSQIDRDGLHLRLALLRAALERLARVWGGESDTGRADPDLADVVVLAGGAFAALPPAAAALAVVDAIRRPGGATILYDHARVMAPLGALPVESDRRRLVNDLMDDCLLPLGSALVTGPIGRDGGGRGRVAISTPLGREELQLEAGQLHIVDLPPGIVGQLDIEPTEGAILGVQGRRLQLQLSGGLGGLVIDTRDMSLSLPEAGEARRAALEAWEEPVWAGSD